MCPRTQLTTLGEIGDLQKAMQFLVLLILCVDPCVRLHIFLEFSCLLPNNELRKAKLQEEYCIRNLDPLVVEIYRYPLSIELKT